MIAIFVEHLSKVEEGRAWLFKEIKKSVLVFGTNTQIVSIYGLNVSFEIQF